MAVPVVQIALGLAGPCIGSAATLLVGRWKKNTDNTNADTTHVFADAKKMEAETDHERMLLETIRLLHGQLMESRKEADNEREEKEEWRQKFWRKELAKETIATTIAVITPHQPLQQEE